MENKGVGKWVIIWVLVMTVSGQTLFSGLNIDPLLLRQADSAMSDLKTALQQNFNCRPSFSLQGGFLGSILKTAFFPFKGLKGFDGYSAVQPKVTCLSRQGAVFYSIYQKVAKAIELLQKVRQQLIQYNNIIIGSNNAIVGSNNLVIASEVSFKGNNNWVFTSDYQAKDPLNGVLIIGLYLIELQDIMQITYNPTAVIRCIEQAESNKQFSNFWTKSSPYFRYSF